MGNKSLKKIKKGWAILIISILILTISCFGTTNPDGGNGGGTTNPDGGNGGGTTSPDGGNGEDCEPSDEITELLSGTLNLHNRDHQDPALGDMSKSYIGFFWEDHYSEIMESPSLKQAAKVRFKGRMVKKGDDFNTHAQIADNMMFKANGDANGGIVVLPGYHIQTDGGAKYTPKTPSEKIAVGKPVVITISRIRKDNSCGPRAQDLEVTIDILAQ